jgi:hypothetical protein
MIKDIGWNKRNKRDGGSAKTSGENQKPTATRDIAWLSMKKQREGRGVE